MNRVYLMRGPSGSGKSTWIKNNIPNAKIISTDNYFMVNGEYKFDPLRLPEYHNQALTDYLKLLQEDALDIVVDNTNIRVFEIAPYYRLAEVFGYKVTVIWIVTKINNCIERNVHGVPSQTIKNQMMSIEPLPPWWNVDIVVN